jgi:hypothetical protein
MEDEQGELGQELEAVVGQGELCRELKEAVVVS